MMSLGWRRYPGITVAADRTLKMKIFMEEEHQIEIGNSELKTHRHISKLYDVPGFGEGTNCMFFEGHML